MKLLSKFHLLSFSGLGCAMISHGKYTYGVLFLTAFSLVASAVEMFGVGVLVVAAQCDLDMDVHQRGLVSALPMLGIIASAQLWGYLADTRGRRLALSVTMLGTTATAIFSSFAPNWIFLAVTKFLSAAFASGTYAVVYALMGEVTPARQRPRYLYYCTTCMMLSQLVYAGMAYPVLKLQFSFSIPMIGDYRPWRLLAKLYGVLSLISLLFLYTLTEESPKYYFSKGEDEKGIEVLRRMYAINHGTSPENYKIKSISLDEKIVSSSKKSIFRSMWDQVVPLFYREHVKYMVLLSYLSVVVYSFTPAFAVWLPAIFAVYTKDIHTDKSICQLLQKKPVEIANSSDTEVIFESACDDRFSDLTLAALCAVSVYCALATALSAALVPRAGKRCVFVAIHLVTAVLTLTINLVHSIGSLAIFIIMFSTGMGIGIITNYTVELFPTYLRAMAVCMTIMIGRAFSFVSITLIGPQLETNCVNFLYIMGAFLISGAIAALFLPSDKTFSEPKPEITKL